MEKVSCKIGQKAENIFLHTSITFQKISTLNISDGAKQIYPKKQKKILLRKDTMRISEAVVGRYSVKKVALKICPLFNCISLKKTLSSEQQPVQTGQNHDIGTYSPCCNFLLLFFCRSSNKNVLECFQPIISKEYTLTRSTNLLSRNHPTSFFY